MKPAVSQHEERVNATMRAEFREEWPGREEQRAAEIAALPTVEWKGKRLYTLRCHGTSGKGPHDVNVPESLLWALISLKNYRCPFHAGDIPATEGEAQPNE